MVEAVFRFFDADEGWWCRILQHEQIGKGFQCTVGHLLGIEGILEALIVEAQQQAPIGAAFGVDLVDTRDSFGNPLQYAIESAAMLALHELLETLASEFRSHATGKRNAPQVFVTTHQPYFVNALRPEETWILEKGEDGFSTIRRASDDKIVKSMVDEGLPLGGLWYSNYLD